jgi:ribonuclease R
VKRPRKPRPDVSRGSPAYRPSPPTSTGLPDRAALAAFVQEAGETDVGDIAKHFDLKGADRRALRQMLKDLAAAGALGRRGRRSLSIAGAPPPVGVVEVVERDIDGDLFVQLLKGGEDLPAVRLAPDRGEQNAGAPGLGDRLLVRFARLESGALEARLIKRLGQGAARLLGVVRKARGETRVEPVNRKVREGLILGADDARLVKDGDLVLCAAADAGERRYGPRRGRVLETIGREDDARAFSLLAIHSHAIPTGFP